MVFLCKHENRQRYKRIELEDLESKVKRRKLTNLDKAGLTIKARPLQQPPMQAVAQSRGAQQRREASAIRRRDESAENAGHNCVDDGQTPLLFAISGCV